MKITKLAYQKKDPNRANVYVDDKFVAGLELKDVIRLGLFTGQEISSEWLNQIIGESEFGKLFNSALNFLSYRPRSEWEIRQKLKFQISRNAKFLPKAQTEDPKLIDQIVDKLKKIGQINDEEFVRWLIDQRQTFRQMGTKGIKYDLLKRGVERKTINKVFSEPMPDNTHKLSESQLAFRAIAKLAGRLKPTDYDKNSLSKTRTKLQCFLASRGFDWEVIEETVEKTLKKGYTA